MEPAEALPEKPVIDDSDLQGDPIVLKHHSMLTPSTFNFSVLRSTTQNFQFRGFLWLTNHRLIYKGFFIKEMGARKISEKLMKPICEVDIKQPISISILIEDISDIYIGHDSTFQKRFQRYPKLRVQFKSNGEAQTFYFYLTRENLIDDELYINKRCSEWRNKIIEIKKKLTGMVTPPTPTAPNVPLTPTVKAGADAATVPKVTKLLDTLVPVSEEKFQTAAADTSISKCPHCGWILGYSTFKCPRCRKKI